MTDLNLKPVQHSTHPAPNLKEAVPRVEYSYRPSPDGIDSNLLIFFHGLGDTYKPFAQLAFSLNLPQTAVLSLQAPAQIPLLEEPAFQWWDSFDDMGGMIPNPNPTATLYFLHKIISHLTSQCNWVLPEIHFFGFAQGGSAAGELALHLARNPPPPPPPPHPSSSSSPSTSTPDSIGSIVSISGPLLSHPTSTTKPTTTKVCLVYRHPTETRIVGTSSWRKGFGEGNVREVKLESGRGKEGMPRGMDEWKEIMRFWSEVLIRRSALERGGDVYELAGGIDAAKAAGVKR